jgi:hypothetical protein
MPNVFETPMPFQEVHGVNHTAIRGGRQLGVLSPGEGGGIGGGLVGFILVVLAAVFCFRWCQRRGASTAESAAGAVGAAALTDSLIH